MRMRSLCTVVVVLCALSRVGAAEEDSLRETRRRALTDLRGVFVKTAVWSDATRGWNLDLQDLLHTDIELRLRKAEVPVFTSLRDVALSPGNPTLWARVRTWPAVGDCPVQARLELELEEEVLLTHESPVVAWATIWTAEDHLYGKSQLNDLRTYMADLVDQFINDYLAMNPKEQIETDLGTSEQN